MKLASPICIKAEEHEDGGDHDGIKEIQLVLNQEQYSALRPKLGKRVFLTGALYEAFNGHHHTPVLLTVKK